MAFSFGANAFLSTPAYYSKRSRFKVELEPFNVQRTGSDVNLRVLTSGRLKRSSPGILAWPTCSACYSVVERLNLEKVPILVSVCHGLTIACAMADAGKTRC
jgi:hypothetical protein